jgi:O-antigen ligase
VISGRTIANKHLSLTALSIAVVALPFSIVLCHAGFIAFIVCWAFEGRWLEKLSIIKKNILLQCILFFALWLILGMLYTKNLQDGWFALERKIFFFIIPVALATTKVKLDEKEIRLLFYLFVATCLAGTFICLGYAVWQKDAYIPGAFPDESIGYLNSSEFRTLNPEHEQLWLFFSYTSLSKGIAIHPSYFSLYLAFCIFFLFQEILSVQHLAKMHKALMGFVIFLFSVIIICLSSRIIIIGLITLYILIAGYWLLSRRSLTATLGITTLLLLVLTLLFVNPVSRYRNLQEIALSSFAIHEKSVYKTSAEIRASLWWIGLKSYSKTNPWLGAGTGDVTDLTKQTSDAYEITNVLETYDPHNQYLYILIGNGIPGLLAFILCLAFPAIRAWVLRDYLFLAFSFLFAALCLTESAFELQKGVAFFTLFYSLLIFQRRSFQSETLNLKFFSAGS